MPSQRTNRRTFGFSLATAPAALIGGRAALAQTPVGSPVAQPAQTSAADPLGLAAQIVATPAADLLQRLTSTKLGPSEFLLFGEFTPSPWQDPITGGQAPAALGGVLWTRFGGDVANQNDVLGGCIVLPDVATAETARQTYLNGSSASGRTIVPMQFGGLAGFAAVSSDAYADAISSIGNLVIFAADIFLSDGARTNRNASLLRATNHAVAILDHLETLSRLQDTA